MNRAPQRRVRIDLGYDGARFFGSQRQSGVRTVQEELERALERVTGLRTSVVMAGRTDRGVHAVGQVASTDVEWSKSLETLRYGLDSVTESDLAIYSVADAARDFDARRCARSREYRYRIWCGTRRPILTAGRVWWIREMLSLPEMNRASELLIGMNDFRSFTGKGFGSGEATRNTRRMVDIANWRTLPEAYEPRGMLIEFRIRASAFLPHMVRNIVGAVSQIGLGRRDQEWLAALMAAEDRQLAPAAAPAEGLTLWRIEYESEDEHSDLQHELEQE